MATADMVKADEIVSMLEALTKSYKQSEGRQKLAERVAVMADNLQGENINDIRRVLERWPQTKPKFPAAAADIIREIRASSKQRPSERRSTSFFERVRELDQAAMDAFEGSELARKAGQDRYLYGLRRWVEEVVSMQARTIARCEQLEMPVQPGRKDRVSRELWCLDEMQQAGRIHFTVPEEVIQWAREHQWSNPWWNWNDAVMARCRI